MKLFFEGWKRFGITGRIACMVLILAFINSCRPPVQKNIHRAFYYWKTGCEINPAEQQELAALRVQKLYVRFFDIVWNEKESMPQPVAELFLKDSNIKSFSVVPVIFITNETLVNTDSSKIEMLAANACKLLTGLLRKYSMAAPTELQIDCDWTVSTKSNYFRLLQSIRSVITKEWGTPITLSATIRLYQCKYVYKTGIPPVDKGLLMCYNMGNLKDPAASNSILSINDLKDYTASLEKFPLPMDIALPLFDWMVLFRNRRYAGLVRDIPVSSLTATHSITQSGNNFIFEKDEVLNGYSFQKGDVLREEQSHYEDVMSAAKLVAGRLRSPQPDIILYHLDSLTLSKYTIDEMENIFSCFH